MARLDAVGTSSLASVRTIAGSVRAVASKVPIRRSRFTWPQFHNFLILRKLFGFGNSAPGAAHLLWERKCELVESNSSLVSLQSVGFVYFLSASIEVQHV